MHEPLQLLVLHAGGHGRVYWKAVLGLLRLLPSLGRDRALTNGIRVVPRGACQQRNKKSDLDSCLKDGLNTRK